MKKLIPWLGVALIITIIFGTIYVSVQQSLRLSANDAQIQTAENVVSQLNEGAKLPSPPLGTIDLATSLQTVTTIYNRAGQPLYSSGQLNHKLPTIPKGVLTAANNKDYNAVTWQPQKGVRLAAVAVSANNYYVVSARSLRDVEKRESNAFHLAGYGWTASMVVLILIYGLPLKRRADSPPSGRAAYVAPEAKHPHVK